MSDAAAEFPAWIYKRDGRLVPFEPDKISRALFAAGESLGRPDPFMARELTDGVLHFLAAEMDHGSLTTVQVAEVLTKVVRELGQPALAQACVRFAEQRPPREQRAIPPVGPSSPPLVPLPAADIHPQTLAWQTSGAHWREFALQEIFGRDIVAAHRQGLLVLGGLEACLQPVGGVLGPAYPGRVLESLEEARHAIGSVVAVDAPEYAFVGGSGVSDVHAFVRELRFGLRARGLRAVLNLNCRTPPSWAADLAEGPLFRERPTLSEPSHLSVLAAAFWEEVRSSALADRIRVDWHVDASAFVSETPPILTSLVRSAYEGHPVAFALDRPRRPIALAEGLDRDHGAVLMNVDVDLCRLMDQLGDPVTPPEFLKKLESLARLALSAGRQKRDFLRRYRTDWPGFLLAEARLIVVPRGIETVVRRHIGRGPSTGGQPADFARQIVQRLDAALAEAGQAVRLGTGLDSWPVDSDGDASALGLTCADAAAAPRSQLKAAGSLHAAAGGGTAFVLFPEEARPTTEDLIDLLRYAWQQTGVVRVSFLRVSSVRHQLMAPWT